MAKNKPFLTRRENPEQALIPSGHTGAHAGKYAANTSDTLYPIPFTLSQAYSSIGGQVQTRFLSPKAWSMRPTVAQNFQPWRR